MELKHRVECNGIYITDIMCAFKGDNPASQLESGQQKNGDFVGNVHYLLKTLQTSSMPCP